MQVYYNDIDPYCCKVLQKNMNNGNLLGGFVDERDIRDIRASDLVGYNHIHLFAGIGGFPLGFKWAGFPGHIRILTGGFPCQDISNAGKRAGITGERSGLWSEMYRIICESFDSGAGYDYICIENVAALLHRGLDTVLSDLAKIGLDAEWICLRASDFGAPHLRNRVFLVAYTERQSLALRQSIRGNTRQKLASIKRGSFSAGTPDVAHAGCEHERRRVFSGHGASNTRWADNSSEWSYDRQQPQMGTSSIGRLRANWWRVEPDVGRMAPRVPARVDRLRGLGNAIVPQCAQYVARCIMASLECQEVAG